MSIHATPTNRELARLIAAARRAGTRKAAGVPIAAPFFLALAIFLHASTRAAFLLSPVVGVPAGPPVIEVEEESRAMRGVGLAVVASVGVVSGAASAQEAVQWRVEDGGNGHWYRVHRTDTPLNWSQSRDLATGSGGALATVRSDEQNLFLLSLVLPQLGATEFGPWLGARRRAGTSPSICDDWRWEDDLPFDYVPVMPPDSGSFGYGPCGSTCECLSNSDANEPYLQYWRGDFPIWNSGLPWATSPLSLIEWSADCNADGIVDYGQILAGELDDANGNNIPDCCEADVPCNCPADLDASGAVNGVDLAIILNTWGTNGGKYPQADIDGDGVVGGADLALVLGAWGECQ